MTKPRSIFEEVSGDEKPGAPTPETGMISRGRGNAGRGAVRVWLGILFVMVAAIVMVGGLTRLTDSGLSITEWNLVWGFLPPMSGEDWLDLYNKYRATPEFQLQNANMNLDGFRQIFWWEWGHRVLGRLIGLVWFFGFVGLYLTKRIPRGWTGRLVLIGALIGLQGAVGWWMVSSGLVENRVDVVSYRLATHLGLAFIILGLITWFFLSLGRSEAEAMQARRAREGRLFSMNTGLMHLVFLQILLGALVAGIDAGRSFVDWPWMADQFFPPDAFDIVPAWRNFFENAGLVQFIHRMSGYLVVIFALVVWARSRKSPNGATRRAVQYVAIMALVQMGLGIYTVLTAAQLHIAITHQVGAILLWVLIINARHKAGFPIADRIRG